MPTTRRWRSCCGRCPKRCLRGSKQSGIAGATITLKLKTADFRIRTRARSLAEPTAACRRASSRPGATCCKRETDGTKFRLIGIGASNLDAGVKADAVDLIVDRKGKRAAEAEHAIDKVREKFGKAAMVKGLVFDGAVAQADDEDDET